MFRRNEQEMLKLGLCYYIDMKIILIRHVQTEFNKSGFAQGKNDSELSEKGQAQLKNLANHLENENISAIFCSNLGRSIKTAKAIASKHNIEVTVDDRLAELDWGELSKLKSNELLAEWKNIYEEKIKTTLVEEIRLPKGENYYDHKKRIESFLKDIANNYKDKTIVIVGHAGTNKVLIGLLKGLNEEETYKLKQDNACINTINLDENGKLIDSDINNICHL